MAPRRGIKNQRVTRNQQRSRGMELQRLDAEQALKRVTDLLDQARAVIKSATIPLTADAIARMPESQLRADPILAVAFQRGWEARTADLQRVLQTSILTNQPQQQPPKLRVVRKHGSPQQLHQPSTVPEVQTKWLSESQKRTLRLLPDVDPHPVTTEWTGMPKKRGPRVLPVNTEWRLPAGVTPAAATTIVANPVVETAKPATDIGFNPSSEAAEARKQSFEILSARRKAHRLDKKLIIPSTVPLVPVTGNGSTEPMEVDPPASKTKTSLGVLAEWATTDRYL